LKKQKKREKRGSDTNFNM